MRKPPARPGFYLVKIINLYQDGKIENAWEYIPKVQTRTGLARIVKSTKLK